MRLDDTYWKEVMELDQFSTVVGIPHSLCSIVHRISEEDDHGFQLINTWLELIGRFIGFQGNDPVAASVVDSLIHPTNFAGKESKPLGSLVVRTVNSI